MESVRPKITLWTFIELQWIDKTMNNCQDNVENKNFSVSNITSKSLMWSIRCV